MGLSLRERLKDFLPFARICTWFLTGLFFLPPSLAALPDQQAGGPFASLHRVSRGDGLNTVYGVSPQPSVVATARADKEVRGQGSGLAGFFIIGLLINVIVVALFARWFVGEWKRTRRSDDPEP